MSGEEVKQMNDNNEIKNSSKLNVSLSDDALSNLFTNWNLKLNDSVSQGRYITCNNHISAQSIIYQSIPYAYGIHDSYKKRICGNCFTYVHTSGYTLSCDCDQVYYCSDKCYEQYKLLVNMCYTSQNNQNNNIDNINIPWDKSPWNSYFTPSSSLTCPYLCNLTHIYDCGIYKKLKSLKKIDKECVGVIKMVIMIYHRIIMEKDYEAYISKFKSNTASLSNSSSSNDMNEVNKSFSAVKLDNNNSNTINYISSDGNSLIIPTYHHFLNLIGHHPPIIRDKDISKLHTFSTHSQDWYHINKEIFSKILNQQYDMELIFKILAIIECNAFSLYAPHKIDNTSSEENKHEADNTDTNSNDNNNKLNHDKTNDDSLDKNNKKKQSSSSGSSFKDKCIGRVLYPTASYYNHSCVPNSMVIQREYILNIVALRDILPGEEINISYIVENQPTTSRRDHLSTNYYFNCLCSRCCDDETNNNNQNKNKKQLKLHNNNNNNTEYKKISYASDKSREQNKKKKGVLPKKKKLEVIYHSTTSDSNDGDNIDKSEVKPTPKQMNKKTPMKKVALGSAVSIDYDDDEQSEDD